MNIDKTCELVKALLTNEPECRNSDDYLYRRIIDVIGYEVGENIGNMPVGMFFAERKLYGVPKYETVRRARQKLQAQFPDLAASKPVELGRMLMEAETRAWARGSIE